MATPIIGFIILGLTIIAAVGGILFKHFSWEKSMPKEEYRGVRYELRPGCIDWPDMKEAIDTMFETFEPATVDKVISDLWIRVIPYDKPISTQRLPSGYVNSSGRPAAAPKTDEEAMKVSVLIGLTEFEKKWPIGRQTAMVYVRQHRPSDTKLDARLMRGTGPIIADAARSAIFHEIAEHVNPYRKDEGSNAAHSRPELTELSKLLTTRCLAKWKVIHGS